MHLDTGNSLTSVWVCKDTGCLIPLRFSTPTGEFKDSYFGEDIKRSEEAREREIEEKENVLYADSERILSSLCKEVMLIATDSSSSTFLSLSFPLYVVWQTNLHQQHKEFLCAIR